MHVSVILSLSLSSPPLPYFYSFFLFILLFIIIFFSFEILIGFFSSLSKVTENPNNCDEFSYFWVGNDELDISLPSFTEKIVINNFNCYFSSWIFYQKWTYIYIYICIDKAIATKVIEIFIQDLLKILNIIFLQSFIVYFF